MSVWTAGLPHLLRPYWLLALLALPALWWLSRRRARTGTPWQRAVDPHLLPSLLQSSQASRRPAAAWLFAACWVIAVLALAGPAWRQPVPAYALQAPLVIVQDMSPHMLVADLPPSRLLRARLKIQQLIAERKGGQIGLVAYAGDAFTVAPLSDDAHSLDDLVVALAPDTMPVDGQRADRALHRAADLLAQAGFRHGTILLLSDTADADAQQAARDAHARGYEVDALGVGTAAGAPLPNADGSFAQDDKGGIRIARLDADALRRLADAGGGRFAELTATTEDLAALGVLDATSTSSLTRASTDAIAWHDDGPFLLLVLVPLVALGFRRGWLAVVLLAMLSLPAHRVEAKEAVATKEQGAWDGLWQRADQRADQALRAGDAASASDLAQTTAQRAAAAYRKGDYAAAAGGWATLGDADAYYNRGNALAQMQRYPQAIDAWQHALRLRPDMADARANIDIVRQLQRRQAQQNQQNPNQRQNQQQQSQQQQSQQQNKQQQSQQQQSQQQQSQQQQSQQQQSQQQGQPRQDQQGQSRNQENMQRSQQQAQQQGGSQGRQQPKPQQQPDGQRQESSQPQDAAQQPAPDTKRQAQADTAEKLALQQALMARKKDANGQQHAALAVKESTEQRERREANESLLQRVPDDPGSLLRRKFALEYARRQQEGDR